MAISRSQLLKELLPGLNALFGLDYAKYAEEHTAIFDSEKSDRSFEEEVKLSGFGKYDLRDKRQRPGRNPKTGEEIPITARRVVTFRPGQKLKARVEAYAGTQS